MAKKSFALINDRLYFIKKCETIRYCDGNFEDNDKVIFKKIPYTYEILPNIELIHDVKGHISFKNIAKKFLDSNFFLDNIDVITEHFSKERLECFSKFHSKKLAKQ